MLPGMAAAGKPANAVWREHRRWGKGWGSLEAQCEGKHGGAEDGNEVKQRTQDPVLQIAGVVPVRSVKYIMSYSRFHTCGC